MPHRVKNKHRARHRAHTFKAASLSQPALPLPAEQAPTAGNAEPQPEQSAPPAVPEPVDSD